MHPNEMMSIFARREPRPVVPTKEEVARITPTIKKRSRMRALK